MGALVRRRVVRPTLGRGWATLAVLVGCAACAADPAPAPVGDPAAPVDTPPPAVDTADTAPDLGPPPDALPPDQRGPYPVGARTVVVDGPIGPLTVEIWYPAIDDGSGTAGDYVQDWLVFPGGALRDAVPDPRGAPLPVAVFSHGFGGIRFQSFFLAEHLASHGVVVAAPDHAGSTLLDLRADQAAEVAARRPAELTATLDALADHLPVPLALDRVAAIGHSFGGWTVLVSGGGRIDVDAFATRCDTDPAPACGFFEGQVLPADDVARWSVPDPRVATTIALAPGAAYAFGADGLAGVAAPLVLGGTRDGDMPYAREIRPVFDALGAPKTLGALHDAGHWAFTDLCRLIPTQDCAGAAKGYMDPERVRAITTSRVLAKVRVELLGRQQDGAWLVGDEDLDWVEVGSPP